MEPIKLLIVDDHPLVREALQDAIDSETDFEIVGEAINGSQAVELALKLKPGVILMDLFMPGMDGIEATRQIMARLPLTKILVLTSSMEDEKVIAAIRAGAAGYMLKNSRREQILLGLREVAWGRPFIPSEIGAKLARALLDEQIQSDIFTERENSVLNLIVQGLSNLEIANTLSISEATVRVHISHCLRKLNLKHRSQLAIYAQKKLGS